MRMSSRRPMPTLIRLILIFTWSSTSWPVNVMFWISLLEINSPNNWSSMLPKHNSDSNLRIWRTLNYIKMLHHTKRPFLHSDILFFFWVFFSLWPPLVMNNPALRGKLRKFSKRSSTYTYLQHHETSTQVKQLVNSK